MSTTLAWLLVFAAGINSCIGNLLLKKARMGGETGLVAMLLNPYFLGGMCFYGVNVVLFGKALERLPVSSAYPVLAASGFALLIVAAVILYKEPFGWNQAIGVGAILFGILMLVRR